MTETRQGIHEQPLEWDSAFFGVRVGRVSVSVEAPGSVLIDYLEGLPYDVVYVSLRQRWEELMRELGVRAQYVNDRCTFQRRVRPGKMHPNIVRASAPATAAVRALAIEAGHESRFRKDERLRPHFERMYQIWLDRALSKDSGGTVFTYQIGGEPVGLRLICGDEVGQRTLLAVAASHRRQGIGTALLDAADYWYSSHGIATCCVITQDSNHGAVELYLRAGYRLVEQTPMFHFWR
jgi:GNAT superfamily N-acetyltransferase